MPTIELAPTGNRTVFRISFASISEEELSTTWFNNRPEIDGTSGERLVPMEIDNFFDQKLNPHHPNQSVIPARMIFQGAPDAAYAPDYGPATQVRAALSEPLTGGLSYRKIELLRPSIPGQPVGVTPYRPYPMYKLCWKSTRGDTITSLRLPISGRLYLPLTNDTYTFWVIPRSSIPMIVGSCDHVQLSIQMQPPKRYIGLPNTNLDISIGAASYVRIYTHLQEYDSLLAWNGFRQVAPKRGTLKQAARKAWNLPYVGCTDANPFGVCDWFIMPITTEREDYRQLYGYFRESAGRHGLSPEFLQVIFFGEGGALAISGPFDPAESLDTFDFVGLDLALYRTGQLPLGADPVPQEAIDADDPDEIAEYTFNLVDQGYVDDVTKTALSFDRVETRDEGGMIRTLHIGRIAGWRAAIELVAAELHARLDEMTDYLAGKVPPTYVVEENQRRFLAYVRFNSRPVTARGHADNLTERLHPWRSEDTPNNGVLFNTIQRIAVTH